MPTTIDDVAKHAAVSTATVSRALRGLPNVASSTRERIFEVADRLNYVVDPQLSRMLSGRRRVAVLLPLVDQWFYSKLATTLELELLAANCELNRFYIDTMTSQHKIVQRLVQQQLVDGIICVSLELSPANIDTLSASSIHVITVETRLDRYSSIIIDNIAAAELATRHCINLGHRRIGLILGVSTISSDSYIVEQRRRGYINALHKADLPVDASLEYNGDNVYSGGAEAMKHLLSIHDPPSAVFAFSDEMAIGALKTLRDLNLKIPEDISVIGFDDNDLAEYLGLTTIKQPVTGFAEQAAKGMVKHLLQAQQEVRHITLEAELTIRSSTGPYYGK